MLLGIIPKLLRLSCRYHICKKLFGSTPEGGDDLEPQIVCEAAQVCLGINAESKCKPSLSGPSIRRTIAGAVSAVDLRCKFRPATGS